MIRLYDSAEIAAKLGVSTAKVVKNIVQMGIIAKKYKKYRNGRRGCYSKTQMDLIGEKMEKMEREGI